MRGRAALVVLVALVSLAGCFGGSQRAPDPTPSDTFADQPCQLPPLGHAPLDLVTEHTPIPMADGKKMDTWVYRPKTDEKVPVFINFSPYWSNLASPAGEKGDDFSKFLIECFVPRGFAIVLTSVRGTGSSEGCFNIGGTTEKQDAAAVIEFLARQPWSNGNVGAGGKSYDGTTPQGVATIHPPALKAIMPVSAISEFYKYNYKGGMPYGLTQGLLFNTYYVMTVGWGEGPIPMGPEADDLCPDLALENAAGLGSSGSGFYDAYWIERDYAKDARNATAPMFVIHGFQDWNVKPDHILPWLNNYGGPKRVWLHQWVTPAERDGHVYPFRQDWNQTLLRFLDQTLRGIDTHFFDEPAVQVEMAGGQRNRTWRTEATWPPANVTVLDLFLSSKASETDGHLSKDAGDGSTRSFLDDGAGPTPTPGVQPSGRDPTKLPHQLLYFSDALATDLHLVGVPSVTLGVTTADAGAKVAVTLYDVPPKGPPTVIDWGGTTLTVRDDPRHPSTPVAPGTPYTFTIHMFPQDTLVQAGHKLALAIAGNAGKDEFFPRPGSAAPTGIIEGRGAVLHVPQQFGNLTLETPQPAESRDCWAC